MIKLGGYEKVFLNPEYPVFLRPWLFIRLGRLGYYAQFRKNP